MKTIFTVGAVVLATCLLSGCVNEQKVNQLASNVQTALLAYVRRMIKKSPAACQLPGIFFNVQPPL